MFTLIHYTGVMRDSVNSQGRVSCCSIIVEGKTELVSYPGSLEGLRQKSCLVFICPDIFPPTLSPSKCVTELKLNFEGRVQWIRINTPK